MNQQVSSQLVNRKIDKISLKIFLNLNYDLEFNQRKKSFNFLTNFSKNNSLKIIYDNLIEDCIPWAFPVYVSNVEERDSWIEWGIQNKINIFMAKFTVM